MNILSYMVKYVSNSKSEFARKSDKKWLSCITGSQKLLVSYPDSLKKSLSPYKKFLASFSALLAWPWQSMICQQNQQIFADFILAFLAFVGKKLYLPRIVGSTGGLLPSKLADLAIYLTKAYCQ